MRHLLIIFFAVLACFYQRCTKDGSDLLPDGNIVGYVFTFNEFNELQDDHSGVNVFTEGEHKSYQTITDKQGRFELTDLPAGTYKLIFSKPGFGTLKQFGVKHLGGEPTVLGMPFGYSGSAFFLFEIPTTKIEELRIIEDSLFCKFSFLKPVPDGLRVRLSFSLVDNFDLESADFTTLTYARKQGNDYSGKLSFYNSPFRNGDKVYFRGQIDAYTGGGITIFNSRIIGGILSYYDYDENRAVSPSLGSPSTQFSFNYGQ
jgi:hypothetical protein